MNWQEREPDVFYPVASPVTVTETDLRFLESRARGSARGRARLCAHGAAADSLHEMFICLERRSYVRPHRHQKAESALILRGAADLVLFDERGDIAEIMQLSAAPPGLSFVRIDLPVFHTYVLRTESLVFLETTLGPFDRRLTEFASWAPDESADFETYWRELVERVEARSVTRREHGG